MTLSMLFNERSLRKPAGNATTARQWMTEFVKMLVTATADYKIDVLRMHAGFDELPLAPDYPMGKWFNDPEVTKEHRDFILDYATKYPLIKPFITDLPDDDPVKKRSDRFIGSYENDIALGLGFAYLLEGLAISLVSEECWDNPDLTVSRLEETENGDDLIEDTVSVHHAGRIAHLELHRTWISEKNKFSVHNGKDLWQKAKKWYPHLVFSDTAAKQLQALGRADIHLPRIIDRLRELEASTAIWKGNGYDIDTLLQGASHESKETLNEFGPSRTFKDPKGTERLCEMHLKNIPGAWRIHFWPDNENLMKFADGRKILVGYVGPHLETKSGF